MPANTIAAIAGGGYNPSMNAVDRCHDQLHDAGWCVGDCRLLTVLRGPVWMVTATKGEHVIDPRAAIQCEAWRLAFEQAWSLDTSRGYV
jgi:hypothetical protein